MSKTDAHDAACAPMIRELVKSYETPEEGYLVGTIWHHLCRAPRLPGGAAKLRDLKKARWHLDRLIAIETAKEGEAEKMLERFRAAPQMVADPDIY